MKNKIACCSNATELHGVTLCICIEYSLFSRWCVSVIAQICFTTISRCHSRTENTVMKILTCKNSPKCSWSRTCADPQQIYVCTVYIYSDKRTKTCLDISHIWNICTPSGYSRNCILIQKLTALHQILPRCDWSDTLLQCNSGTKWVTARLSCRSWWWGRAMP